MELGTVEVEARKVKVEFVVIMVEVVGDVAGDSRQQHPGQESARPALKVSQSC